VATHTYDKQTFYKSLKTIVCMTKSYWRVQPRFSGMQEYLLWPKVSILGCSWHHCIRVRFRRGKSEQLPRGLHKLGSPLPWAVITVTGWLPV